MNLYEIKALTAHNKINDLVSKTAVTLNHVFADNAARDAYFVTNPTELVDNLFIKVDTGYQQYINSAWENTEAVIVEQLPAKQQSIEDTDNLYTATNVEDALKEVKTDLDSHKSAYANLVDEVTELAYITQKYTVDSWQKVQDIVRAGLAEKAFKIGDQFIANYNGSPVVWDIIGIDHDKPTDTNYTHSLTIQAHDCIMNCQFDAPEALYYAETELAAGTHIFTLNALQYTFTTAQAIPAGGQVFINAWQSATGAGVYVPTKITTYEADRATAIETDLDVTATTGTDTLAAVNNHSRCRYGSNNYMESAIKQFLNSNATSFAWTPKTNFDRPPSGAPYTGGGFLKLLDPELVAVLGAVDKQVARNTLTDGGGQDLFSDKVFLLSTKEVYGTNEGVITGEDAYPYYSVLAGAATNDALAGRIKYLAGSARYWWLRSPNVGYSNSPRSVNTTGNVNYIYANIANGLAPACCIV